MLEGCAFDFILNLAMPEDAFECDELVENRFAVGVGVLPKARAAYADRLATGGRGRLGRTQSKASHEKITMASF